MRRTTSAIGPSWLQALVSRTISTSHVESARPTRRGPARSHRGCGSMNAMCGGTASPLTMRTVFAQRPQRERQPELAADRVAIGPHVAGENERLRFVHQLHKWSPVDGMSESVDVSGGACSARFLGSLQSASSRRTSRAQLLDERLRRFKRPNVPQAGQEVNLQRLAVERLVDGR